jgi:hypothetical protein
MSRQSRPVLNKALCRGTRKTRFFKVFLGQAKGSRTSSFRKVPNVSSRGQPSAIVTLTGKQSSRRRSGALAGKGPASGTLPQDTKSIKQTHFKKTSDQLNRGRRCEGTKSETCRVRAESGQGRNHLGLLYLNGLGVPKDYVQAYMWFSLAGFQINLPYAKAEMSPAQVLEAGRMAQQKQLGELTGGRVYQDTDREMERRFGRKSASAVSFGVCGGNEGWEVSQGSGAAIDRGEELRLRTVAAAAVAEFGSAETRTRLRPLALGEGGNDPDDELKGSGLKALWPDHMSMQEIRPLLTPPKKSNLSSTYTSFLERDFVQKMKVADIPEALDWFCEQGHRQRFEALDRTMDQIVEAAWTHIEEPRVAAKLVEASLSRMRIYDSLVSSVDDSFEAKVAEDAERRRKLLQ